MKEEINLDEVMLSWATTNDLVKALNDQAGVSNNAIDKYDLTLIDKEDRERFVSTPVDKAGKVLFDLISKYDCMISIIKHEGIAYKLFTLSPKKDINPVLSFNHDYV
jgi:hypothetical protein